MVTPTLERNTQLIYDLINILKAVFYTSCTWLKPPSERRKTSALSHSLTQLRLEPNENQDMQVFSHILLQSPLPLVLKAMLFQCLINISIHPVNGKESLYLSSYCKTAHKAKFTSP